MPDHSRETNQSPGANEIIGGTFRLESVIHPHEGVPSFLAGREVLLNSDRSCIWLLVNMLRPPQVWVPYYLCPQGIRSAIDANGTTVRSYEVNGGLKVHSNQWISEVCQGHLVMFIDYFGFYFDHRYAVDIKKQGAWVVEDGYQALFDHQIYPPVRWNIDGVVPPEFEDSHTLSDQIMALPCGQRYGPEDMEKMVAIFTGAVQ